jgi:hypothetical protein
VRRRGREQALGSAFAEFTKPGSLSPKAPREYGSRSLLQRPIESPAEGNSEMDRINNYLVCQRADEEFSNLGEAVINNQPYCVLKEHGAYFGECSLCGTSICHDIEKIHFFACPTHKIVWQNGVNVMSGWKYMSRQNFIDAAKALEGFTQVEFDEDKVLGPFDLEDTLEYLQNEYAGADWDKPRE